MRRLRILTFLFLFAGIVIIFRLFFWQIIRGEELRTLGDEQYWQFFQVPASRGKIFSSDGFPLVTNQSAYFVYAQPRKIKNKEEFSQKVADILSLDPASTSARLKSSLFFVPLKRKVEREKVEELKLLGLAGLGFRREAKRFYPEGSMSAHLLGFVGSDAEGRDTGYFGLEGFYNLELSGEPGVMKREKDASGQPILSGEWEFLPPQPGYSLLLTLDRSVQFFVERRLEEGVKKFGARRGLVVIMEPETGKILAMASYPHYHPGDWQKYNPSLFKNPVVSDTYEPGSTFKIITMAAGLDSGVVDTKTVCTKCDGPREIGGHKIRTWNDEYYPNSSMVEILQHSDNVGIVFVAERLGLKKFYRYLQNFGFGQPTGIDLQEETSPPLRPLKDWSPIDLASAAFGQGIAVTPIQMVRAVAVVANGGKLVRPFVVEKIIGRGRVIEIEPKIERRVISQKTARILTEMLVSAVEKGEARAFKPPGFKIAGKTGTAQIPIAGHYDPHKTIASFVGFAPANSPKFVMLVCLVEPTASPWGSETAAPLFFDIAQDLYAYFGITP